MKQKTILAKLTTILLPLAFIGSMYLNILAFVLDGHRHEWFRQGLVYGVQGITGVILLVYIGGVWKRRPEVRKKLLSLAAILVVFGLIQLAALVFQKDLGLVLNNAVINGAYLAVMLCGLFVICADNRLESFLQASRIFALTLSPAVLFYCVRFYTQSDMDQITNLGVISYMPLAYMLLDCCVLLMGEVLFSDRGRNKSVRRMNFILTGLFAVAITLSQTKGTMIGLAVFAVLIWIYTKWAGKPCRGIGRQTLACLAIIVMFSTVLYPSQAGANRLMAFFQELHQGEALNITLQDIQDTNETVLDNMEGDSTAVQQPENAGVTENTQQPDDGTDSETPLEEAETFEVPEKVQDVVDFYYTGQAQQALDEGKISQEQFAQLEEIAVKLNTTNTGGRVYLWTCALAEMRDAPILGKGPLSFQGKYGMAPHNFFLEVGTDFGIPVMMGVLTLGIYVFYRLILRSRKEPMVALYLIYVFTNLPKVMLSGSAYMYYVWFQYAVCIWIVFAHRKSSIK